MDLTPPDILAFMQAWYQAFGEVLSYEQAEIEAKRLVGFFVALAEARMKRENSSGTIR